MSNPFLHSNNKYHTNLDPIGGYVKHMSVLIAKQQNISIAKASELIKDILREEKSIVDPVVRFWHRDKYTLDKKEDTMPLSRFIQTIISEDLVVAPSFTCYRKTLVYPDGSERKYQSLDSKWTEKNAEARNVYKKKAKQAKAVKNTLDFEINNSIQKTKKTRNNSLSGTYSLTILPFATHSAHYTLTSTTRIVSGIGNMISEKMIGGNRFYRVKNDVITEFTAIISNINRKNIQAAQLKYQFKVPTTDDIINMVRESSKFYWIDETYMDFVRDFVDRLDSIEKMGILYVHDIFHIEKLNPYFIQTLFQKLGTPQVGVSDDIEVLKNGEGYILNLTHHVCNTYLRGEGINYDKFKGKPIADRLVSTYLNISETLSLYSDFISTFFSGVFLNPINVGSLKEMTRKRIVLSDTDSTCATYYDLVQKEDTPFTLGSDTVGKSAVGMIFNTELSNHLLKVLTSTMNADKDKWYALEMKPEYTWSVFAPMSVSKHYMNFPIIEELLVIPEEKLLHDVSGVTLIATNIPTMYKDKLDEFIMKITNAISTGTKLSLKEVVRWLISIEEDIIHTTKKAPHTVLKYEKIKEEKTYKQGWQRSNYFHYKLYDEVFKDKYGMVDHAPITALKVPIVADTAKKLIAYAETLEDKTMGANLKDILERSGKQSISNIKLPAAILVAKGVPDELVDIVDYRRIVLDIMKPFYMMLESLGINVRDKYMLHEEHIF